MKLRVPIPENLSHTGKAQWDVKEIDACIAPIVDALNRGGILTAACCCGHGKVDGNIILQDGRMLTIQGENYEPNKRHCFSQRPFCWWNNMVSIFSGAGGGLLATKWMLGWRTIGYVEWDDYCQKVIAQRIKDGLLDEAPIFGDIRAFIGEGYAERYRGMVDVITAGFPCQPFSVAGKQKGADDERNMWPATAQVIEIVRPLRVLLENVPGIRRYLPVVVRDLRRIGYEVRHPLKLGADDVGAPHRRKRVWILAYSRHHGRSTKFGEQQAKGSEIINSSSERDVADTMPEYGKEYIIRDKLSKESRQIPFRGESLGNRGWWAVEPRLGRVAHGVAHRVDRLKAIGNGQVPAVVARVWEILTQGESS